MVNVGTDTGQKVGYAVRNMPECTDCVCSALRKAPPHWCIGRIYQLCVSVKGQRICLTSFSSGPGVPVFEGMCLNRSTHQLLFHVCRTCGSWMLCLSACSSKKSNMYLMASGRALPRWAVLKMVSNRSSTNFCNVPCKKKKKDEKPMM